MENTGPSTPSPTPDPFAWVRPATQPQSAEPEPDLAAEVSGTVREALSGFGRWFSGRNFRIHADFPDPTYDEEDYEEDEAYDDERDEFVDEEVTDDEQELGDLADAERAEEVGELYRDGEEQAQDHDRYESDEDEEEAQPVAPLLTQRAPAPKQAQPRRTPRKKQTRPTSSRPARSKSTDRPAPLLQQGEEDRAGVPARYDDGVQWLASGFRRHRSAVAVGLVFGWTGAWIAFWGAMAGALLGFLAGLSVGSANIPVFRTFGIGQSVSALGVLSGVALGIIGGFLIVLIYLVLHPLALIGSLVSGAILTAVILVITASFERLSLRMRGYRRLSRDEVRRVAPLVKTVADAMDLPALPRFAVADQVLPNAWTHMRTVVLTTGLLQTLDDGELEAILVHEFNHWRNGDPVGLHCVWAAAWPVVLVYNLGVLISGGRPKSQAGVSINVSSAFRWILAWLVAWPAWVMVKVIIAPLTAASQRRYEYEADAAAYDLGLAPQLIAALRKIGAFESGRTGWEAAMTATHPPTQLRIEALQSPRSDDWEYQEEELHGPSWAEIRRIFGGLANPARQRSR